MRDQFPQSGFISIIEPETNASVEGTASIEYYTPIEPSTEAFNLDIWYPVQKKYQK